MRRAVCGTTSGYQSHLRSGVEPCAACKQAHAEYHRAYRNRGKVHPRARGQRVHSHARRRVTLFPPPATFARCRRDCGRLVWDFDAGLCGVCSAESEAA